MTLAVGDDFRDFVAARWPDLEAVALLVTLDAGTSRRVTTDVLVMLHRRWRAAVDEGRLIEATRRDLLAGALSASPPPAPPASTATRGPGAQERSPARADGDHPLPADAAVAALAGVLVRATPLERAVVAAHSVWGLAPDEVAALLGMPGARVRDAASGLGDRLREAHVAARTAQDQGPDDWALDRDLDEAVGALLSGQGDPPDPLAIVGARARRLRRRAVLVGAAVLAATGASSWWALSREDGDGRTTVSRGRTSPGPTDAPWEGVARWPPRGTLATDIGIQSMVAASTASRGRVLWAEDAGRRRIVVALDPGPATPPGPMVQVWIGAAGAAPASLRSVLLGDPWIEEDRDGLALVVSRPIPDRAGQALDRALVVLTRPTVTSASYSRVVRPTRAGTVVRAWESLRLAAGTGVVALAGYAGPAARVRCGGYDGPVFGPDSSHRWMPPPDGSLDSFPQRARAYVAAVTGLATEQLETEVVVDAAVDGGVLAPHATHRHRVDARVMVVRTRTPTGGVVRSARASDDGRSGIGWRDLEVATVLPADTPLDEPLLVRLAQEGSPLVGRFLVVAPGAARVQLVSTSPVAYPTSAVTACRDGVAVVHVPDADRSSVYRVVRHDRSGRVLGAGVPLVGTDLRDLPAAAV